MPLATIEERLATVEQWIRTQQDAMNELKAKVDKAQFWLIGIMGALVVDLGMRLIGKG